MVREHLGLCPLRNSPLRTCGGVAASSIPKAGWMEALDVPGWGFWAVVSGGAVSS